MTKKPRDPNRPQLERVDDALVRRGLAPDITKARAIIMAGQARIGDQPVTNASQKVACDRAITITPSRRFVSRGGDKLHFAITTLRLGDSLRDKVVLDVGASTGGFTDCCLAFGARQVIALDVGSGLLDWSLRNDPRVITVEGTHIKDFNAGSHPPIDWVVADISFNSLSRLARDLRRAAPRAGVSFLLLVKPQFELGADEVPPGGIVDDERLRAKALDSAREALRATGLGDGVAIDCDVAGRKGNREIFILTRADSDFES